VGGVSFGYDGNGNRVSRSEGTSSVGYTYDAENRLVEVSKPLADDTTFVYDADGARIKRARGDTATYYIGPIEIETDSGDVVESHSIYGLGGGVSAVRTVASPGDDGEVTFTFGDHLGSSSTIWQAGELGDTDPGVRSFQRYYPYGEPRDDYKPSLPTDHTFTGQISDGLLGDGGTGLMYYQARYYDPQVGRFAAADTIVPNPANPQDLNRYAYVGNNPVNGTDPSGHDAVPYAEELVKAAAVICAASGGTACELVAIAAVATLAVWCAVELAQNIGWFNLLSDAGDWVQYNVAGGARPLPPEIAAGYAAGYGAAAAVSLGLPPRAVDWTEGSKQAAKAAGAGVLAAETGAEHVDEVLSGLPSGESGENAQVGSVDELKDVYEELISGAGSYDHSQGWPSARFPDGTTVTYRPSSKSGGPTIDVDYPDGSTRKVHLDRRAL